MSRLQRISATAVEYGQPVVAQVFANVNQHPKAAVVSVAVASGCVGVGVGMGLAGNQPENAGLDVGESRSSCCEVGSSRSSSSETEEKSSDSSTISRGGGSTPRAVVISEQAGVLTGGRTACEDEGPLQSDGRGDGRDEVVAPARDLLGRTRSTSL